MTTVYRAFEKKKEKLVLTGDVATNQNAGGAGACWSNLLYAVRLVRSAKGTTARKADPSAGPGPTQDTVRSTDWTE